MKKEDTLAFRDLNMAIPFALLIAYSLFIYFYPAAYLPLLDKLRAPYVLVFLTFGLAIIKGARPPRAIQTWILFFILIFAIISRLTSKMPFFFVSIGFEEDVIVTFTQCIAIYMLISTVINSRENLSRFLFIILFFTFVVAVGSILAERLGIEPLRGHVYDTYQPFRRITNYFGGIGTDPNEFGAFMLSILPIPMCMMQGEKSLLKKLFFLAVSITIVFAVVMTGSRGAFVGLVVILLFLIWEFRKKIGFLLLIAVIIIYAGIKAPYGYWERIATLRTKETAMQEAPGRIKQMEYSYELIKKHPLTGVGLGNFRRAKLHLLGFNPYESEAGKVAHNTYLELAVEIGLPGLILFLLAIYLSIKDLLFSEKVFGARDELLPLSKMARGIRIGFIGLAIAIFFLSEAYNIMFYQCIALAVIFRKIAERNVTEETKTAKILAE